MSRLPLTELERADLEATASLYESVVADLRDVLARGWPSKEELAEAGAPLLDAWLHSLRSVPNLEGMPIGHPHLKGWTRTSSLHALCVRGGVARTQSRWYRLGEAFVGPVGGDDDRVFPTCEVR
ncbi:hypothetical protein [Aureimonas sp. SK2]|uniref:hypothetical protein n=1 Tax=Aureimonas sp. SK2 TaxID=3015992 RepID=UPI002444CF5B|nr:hypothetical protein [Aureimonas sp. SK2]